VLHCRQANWCGFDEGPGAAMAVATRFGTISLLLRDQVRVDMTIDRAIRIINFKVSDLSTVNKYGNLVNALQMQANIEIVF
jgi:hypothetical protein